MNTLKVTTVHRTFETYFFEAFNFSYHNVMIKLAIQDGKLVITIDGEKAFEEILKIFYKVYNLLFLILGGFPKVESLLENNVKLDTKEWVKKYDTDSHFMISEARLCELSLIHI